MGYISRENLDKDLNLLIDELNDKVNSPISANDVSETSNRVFVTANEKATITSNSNDIATLGQKVADLESDLANGVDSTDEKVKLDENDTADYLGNKIDNATLQVFNNKLVVMNMEGLLSSITELNELVGVTGNVQAQIDALSNITNVQGEIANTENDLPQPVSEAGTIVLVREDSTQDGVSTFYRSNGTEWIYINRINADIARDFALNPLNISTETTGTLPKSRYELPNALDVSFIDANGNIQSSNVQDAIKELFTLSNDGKKAVSTSFGSPLLVTDKYSEMANKITAEKSKVASAIINKGVPAYVYNSLTEYAEKINLIPNVSVASGIKTVEKAGYNQGDVYEIQLSEPFKITEVASSIIEYEDGLSNIEHHNETFDSTSKINYLDNELVDFNGQAKLKNKFIVDMDNNQVLGDGYVEKLYKVNSNTPYTNITGFKVVL